MANTTHLKTKVPPMLAVDIEAAARRESSTVSAWLRSAARNALGPRPSVADLFTRAAVEAQEAHPAIDTEIHLQFDAELAGRLRAINANAGQAAYDLILEGLDRAEATPGTPTDVRDVIWEALQAGSPSIWGGAAASEVTDRITHALLVAGFSIEDNRDCTDSPAESWSNGDAEEGQPRDPEIVALEEVATAVDQLAPQATARLLEFFTARNDQALQERT